MSLRILAKNVFDSATSVVSNAAVSGYPGTNLLTGRRSQFARSSDLAGSWQYLSLPASVSINMFGFARTNLSAASGEIYIDVLNASASIVYASGWLGDTGFAGALDSYTDQSARSVNNRATYFSTVSGMRFARIYQRDAASVDGYVEAARAFGGVYKDLTLNFDWANSVEWVDLSDTKTTYGGDLIATYNGPPRRKITLPFNGIPEADRAYLYDLMRVVGTSGELFISLWPGAGGRLERDHQMWCRIADTDALKNTTPGRFGSSITFIEC
jgi:hypothetical protein